MVSKPVVCSDEGEESSAMSRSGFQIAAFRGLVLSLVLGLSATRVGAQSSSGADDARVTNRWFVRVGVLDAIYHPSATIALNGSMIPDATATVSNNVTLMFDIGYDVSKAFSLQLMGGIPPKPTVTGERAVASLGDLGAVRYGPMILTGTYRIPGWRGWQPYVGGGTVYAIVLKDFDGAVSDLIALNNWGVVLQGGVERSIRDNLDLFVDFKEGWLAIDAHGSLSGGLPVTAKVTLNPSVIGVGVKVRFQ
jgi:outer membrane protein